MVERDTQRPGVGFFSLARRLVVQGHNLSNEVFWHRERSCESLRRTSADGDLEKPPFLIGQKQLFRQSQQASPFDRLDHSPILKSCHVALLICHVALLFRLKVQRRVLLGFARKV